MSATGLPSSLSPLCALVVDDVPEIGFAISHFLSRVCEGGTRVANSANEAVAMLERSPVDVIISDLRMPGRDGTSLLAEVQARWPSTLRVLLTGQSQWEAALSSIPYCHQFLSKPTELQTLGTMVNGVKPWMDGTLDPILARCLAGISMLPSPNGCLVELAKLMEQPSPRSGDLAAVIRRDPALSARVIQIANASFFGGTNRINDVDGAVSLVGSQCLQDLYRRKALATGWQRPGLPPVDLNRIARHALVVAHTAKSTLRDPRAAEAAYTAGLLHSVGWQILAMATPEVFNAPRAVFPGLPERMSAQLLAFWGLPTQIVSAVSRSHEPPDEETFGPASAVYLARKIASVVATSSCSGVVPETALSDAFVLRHGLADLLPILVDKAASAELQAQRTLSPIPGMLVAV